MCSKPDYGLKLIEQGVPVKNKFSFHGVRIIEFMVISEENYRAEIEMKFENIPHSLIYIFSKIILEQALEKAGSEIADLIYLELDSSQEIGKIIKLNKYIDFDFNATLGNLETNGNHEFAPFLVTGLI